MTLTPAIQRELPPPTTRRVARRLVANGRVQGVGFRPAVARRAAELGLAGAVRNTTAGVEIVIEGEAATVERFQATLAQHLPPHARLDSLQAESVAPMSRSDFDIEPPLSRGDLSVSVPPDVAVCETCLTEVFDKHDRRQHYPLTSCTDCGPRYSLIESMPYERADTTLSRFTFCPACHREFTNPHDRRFHAQTNACPTCGPRVWCADDSRAIVARDDAAIRAAVEAIRGGWIVALKGLGGYQLLVDATNAAAVARLRARKHRPAKPLAVLVDSLATAESLAFLSDEERRTLSGPAGPIVIVRSRAELNTKSSEAVRKAEFREGEALAEPCFPAVRGSAGASPSHLSDSLPVAGPQKLALDVSKFGTIGLLLPTTPLHALIARDCGPVVATSGNRDGEPLAFDEAAAERELAGIADLWLHHDRPIRRPIDDSVVRVMAGRPVTIRLARGLAPLPLHPAAGDSVFAVGSASCPYVSGRDTVWRAGGVSPPRFRDESGDSQLPLAKSYHLPLSNDREPDGQVAHPTGNFSPTARHKPGDKQLRGRSVLAVGGHQKVAIALWNGSQAVLGPHLGDLDTVASRQRFAAQVEDWLNLYGATPQMIAHDLHPDYFTTQWAAAQGTPTMAVQHHHAHIAAAMLEHGMLDRTVLGVAWDGTGYGPDGTIWGGEFLIASATGYRRVARLRPFRLPGGEAAVREPWRVAVAILHDAGQPAPDMGDRFATSRVRSVTALLANPRLAPVTTSAGRLFDAAAALILPDELFEGHAAMLLEAACHESADGTYPFPLDDDDGDGDGEPAELDWRPLVSSILVDQRAGIAPGVMAMRFHRAIADAILAVCIRHPQLPVVLGGGVFQNRVLVELLAARFSAADRWIGLPGTIPPNDGGLAAGQLAVALRRTECIPFYEAGASKQHVAS